MQMVGGVLLYSWHPTAPYAWVNPGVRRWLGCYPKSHSPDKGTGLIGGAPTAFGGGFGLARGAIPPGPAPMQGVLPQHLCIRNPGVQPS